MMDNPHIFLGPSLSIEEAKKILPNAYYHHPIRCGDLLRLLRLNPKKVLIIDGCYEFTGSIWHKEVCLALELGIEVYGAASMGALRASELHQIGMIGIGQIFEDFKNGTLNDDDEVAVIHQSQDEGFVAVNDAMINIRQTLKDLVSDRVLSTEIATTLEKAAKNQFYPNRNFLDLIETNEALSSIERDNILKWLSQKGMSDVKKQDAILALKTLKAICQERNDKSSDSLALEKMPMTKFINKLIDYSYITPFISDYDFLPEKEKELSRIHSQKPQHYEILSDIALSLKSLHDCSKSDKKSISRKDLESYIHTEKLYNPSHVFSHLKNHPQLAGVYDYILQQICVIGLSKPMIDSYQETAKHFYQLENTNENQNNYYETIITLMILFEFQFTEHKIKLKEHIIMGGLSKLARHRGFDEEKTKAWLDLPKDRQAKLFYFATIREKIDVLHRGLGDILVCQDKITPTYFDWIFDAMELVKSNSEVSLAS